MRRVICVLLCVLLCLCPAEGTEQLSLSARSAILLDADTGTVLYEKKQGLADRQNKGFDGFRRD